MVVAGTDRFGSYVGGGTSLSFSDMLGNHNLSMVFQAQRWASPTSPLLGAYHEPQRRFNWGVVAGQVPYVYGDFADAMTPDGYYVQDTDLIYRQINRQIGCPRDLPLQSRQRVGAHRRLPPRVLRAGDPDLIVRLTRATTSTTTRRDDPPLRRR